MARHGDADLAALLLQPAKDLAGLVGGDSTRNEQGHACGVAVNEHLWHGPYASSLVTTRIRLQYGHVVTSAPLRRMSVKELG